MISEARRRMLPVGLVCVVLLVAQATAGTATPRLRAGGSLGFGWATSRQQGLYKWDFSGEQQGVDLLRLKIEASPAEGLVGFVRVDAPSAGPEDPPEFELGEASLRYRRDWLSRGFVEVRAFARQPQSLWMDPTLGSPLTEHAFADEVLGVRADVRWRSFFGLVLAADPATQKPAAIPADDPLTVLRLGIDLGGGPRVAGTWIRSTPAAADVEGPSRATPLDWGAVDAVWDWRHVLFQVEVATSQPASTRDTGSRPAEPLRAPSGLLADLPSNAALRAEVRAVSLGNARWGWVGFAPSLRAIGSQHVVRRRVPTGTEPRRGTQTWQLDVWYRASRWPMWVRQAVARREETIDADRRTDRWQTEVEATLSPRLRGRLRWLSRRVEAVDETTRHRNLVVDAWFEEIGRRLRAQFGWIDIDRPNEKQALALEFATPILGQWNAVARSAMTRDATALRPSLFAELQYWHLPQFEMALSYGSDVFGDAVDPVFDADQIAAGDTRNVVRVHFRGWF